MGALPSPCIACGSEIWNFLDDDFVNNMVEGIQKLVAALGALDDDLLHGWPDLGEVATWQELGHSALDLSKVSDRLKCRVAK